VLDYIGGKKNVQGGMEPLSGETQRGRSKNQRQRRSEEFSKKRGRVGKERTDHTVSIVNIQKLEKKKEVEEKSLGEIRRE